MLKIKRKVDISKRRKQILANNLPLLAEGIISDIIARTQKGLDANNKAFTDYSKGYKKVKKGKPNLTVSHKMLNNITWRETKKGISIFFKSTHENAKAVGNERKRKFFGIDPKQEKYIAKELSKLVFK